MVSSFRLLAGMSGMSLSWRKRTSVFPPSPSFATDTPTSALAKYLSARTALMSASRSARAARGAAAAEARQSRTRRTAIEFELHHLYTGQRRSADTVPERTRIANLRRAHAVPSRPRTDAGDPRDRAGGPFRQQSPAVLSPVCQTLGLIKRCGKFQHDGIALPIAPVGRARRSIASTTTTCFPAATGRRRARRGARCRSRPPRDDGPPSADVVAVAERVMANLDALATLRHVGPVG